MTNVETKRLEELKKQIAGLIIDSELFECEDQNGTFIEDVVSRVEEQVSIMFSKTNKELAELEEDIYYKTN